MSQMRPKLCEYIGSFPALGTDLKTRIAFIENQIHLISKSRLSRTQPEEISQKVHLLFNISGIHICSLDFETIFSVHALKRICHSICEPAASIFAFSAREPRSNDYHTHVFTTKDAVEVNNIIASAFMNEKTMKRPKETKSSCHIHRALVAAESTSREKTYSCNASEEFRNKTPVQAKQMSSFEQRVLHELAENASNQPETVASPSASSFSSQKITQFKNGIQRHLPLNKSSRKSFTPKNQKISSQLKTSPSSDILASGMSKLKLSEGRGRANTGSDFEKKMTLSSDMYATVPFIKPHKIFVKNNDFPTEYKPTIVSQASSDGTTSSGRGTMDTGLAVASSSMQSFVHQMLPSRAGS